MCHVGARRDACTGCWWVSQRERGHWGDPDVDGEDNIKMDFQEVGVGCGDWIVSSGQGQVAGSCEYGKEPSSSIKCGKFLD
jgi:hypothetical protein